jgi:hypothetical protein
MSSFRKILIKSCDLKKKVFKSPFKSYPKSIMNLLTVTNEQRENNVLAQSHDPKWVLRCSLVKLCTSEVY